MRRDAIEIIVRRSKMGDWFLLYMLGENIDTVIFRDIMQELSNRLSVNQHHHVPGMKGEIQDAWYLYGWSAFTGNELNAIRMDGTIDARAYAAATIANTKSAIDTLKFYCKQILMIIT